MHLDYTHDDALRDEWEDKVEGRIKELTDRFSPDEEAMIEELREELREIAEEQLREGIP